MLPLPPFRWVGAPTSGKSWIRHYRVNLLFCKLFCRKVHKNERIWTRGRCVPSTPPHTLDPQILLSQFIYWTPREGASLAPLPSHPHTLDPQMPLFYYKRLYIVNLDPEGAARPCPPPTHTHTLSGSFSLYCLFGSAANECELISLDSRCILGEVGGLIRGREGGEREG